jgi:hypothetical protein
MDGRSGDYPDDFTYFNIAEVFGIDPQIVMKWPVNVFLRTRLWLSSRNQAEADRVENEKAAAKI